MLLLIYFQLTPASEQVHEILIFQFKSCALPKTAIFNTTSLHPQLRYNAAAITVLFQKGSQVNDIHKFPGNRNRPNEFEKFINEIKKMFNDGGKRSNGASTNGSGGGGGGGKPFNLSGSWAPFLLLAVAIGAWSSVYRVDVDEEAVVMRFGRYISTEGPGLHFKMPFGIDNRVIVKSQRTLQEEFGFRSTGSRNQRTTYAKGGNVKESLMLTGDLNVVNVEWAVHYRISSPYKYLFNVRDGRRTIRDISMSIMRRVVGDSVADQVLTTGRVQIAGAAKVLMQEIYNHYDMGIEVQQVILQDVNPPDPVKPAFNEVNAAKQEQESAINNAEREYNKVIPEARGKADQMISDAEAFAVDVVNRAKGDAAQFNQILAAYKKAPSITKRRQYIETMEQVLTKIERFTVVDKDAKGLLPLYPASQQSMQRGAAAKSAE